MNKLIASIFLLTLFSNAIRADEESEENESGGGSEPSPTGAECLDKASWCNDGSVDLNCYRDNDECCQSCESKKTGDPKCPYGDHFTWCSSYATSKELCDFGETRTDCCITCKKFP